MGDKINSVEDVTMRDKLISVEDVTAVFNDIIDRAIHFGGLIENASEADIPNEFFDPDDDDEDEDQPIPNEFFEDEDLPIPNEFFDDVFSMDLGSFSADPEVKY